MSTHTACALPALTVVKREPEKPSESETHPGCRWLVVDDDALMVELVTLLLEQKERCVHGFTEGLSAWKSITESVASVELVITDRDMPGVDGLELARRIRLEAPHAKVILMTAHHDDLNAEALKKAAIAAVLPKPFSCEQLVSLITSLLPDAMLQIAPPNVLRFSAAA